jgi:hypothetical protein
MPDDPSSEEVETSATERLIAAQSSRAAISSPAPITETKRRSISWLPLTLLGMTIIVYLLVRWL